MHKEILNNLSRFTDKELWGCWDAPYASFQIETPTWFILETPGGLFLVDTEGYDYCRYIAQL